MSAVRFDLHGLFVAVDHHRVSRGLSWSALARQVGVAVTTIRRMEEAEDAEADGVLALVRWLGVAPESFVAGGSIKGRKLRTPGDGHVRVDMELVARANEEPRGAGGRTRTTIQRLVAAAQRSGTPIASLTRSSEV